MQNMHADQINHNLNQSKCTKYEDNQNSERPGLFNSKMKVAICESLRHLMQSAPWQK